MNWKRLNKGLLTDRIEDGFIITKSGYRLKLFAFRTAFVIFLLFSVFLFYSAYSEGIGLRQFYLSCPIDHEQPCDNPVYQNCEYEACKPYASMELLPPGFTVGTDPRLMDRYVNGLIAFLVVLFGATFYYNHHRYNKEYEMDVEI